MSDRSPGPAFLVGGRTLLRPLHPGDFALITRWVNDGDVTYTMFTGQRPQTEQQVAEEWGRTVQSAANIVFLAEEKEGRCPIGLCGLYDVHPTARKAEFRILIGEKAFWNKGCGTEMTELLNF